MQYGYIDFRVRVWSKSKEFVKCIILVPNNTKPAKMSTNLSATADPKIKEIITSLDDDKIGKVVLPFFLVSSKVELTFIDLNNHRSFFLNPLFFLMYFIFY